MSVMFELHFHNIECLDLQWISIEQLQKSHGILSNYIQNNQILQEVSPGLFPIGTVWDCIVYIFF